LTKRKKFILKSVLIPLALLAIIATAVYYINEYVNRPKFIRYAAFGIYLPMNYQIHGIGVSRYQHNIYWD